MNYYKRLKFALRGNIPMMEDEDRGDPYAKRSPGDGKGMKMTTPGDEQGMGASGLGKNEREGQPDRNSMFESGDRPINDNIPSPNTSFVTNKWDREDAGTPAGEGYGQDTILTFTDQNDPLHQNALYPDQKAHGDINMQIQTESLYGKAKKRLRGAFNA